MMGNFRSDTRGGFGGRSGGFGRDRGFRRNGFGGGRREGGFGGGREGGFSERKRFTETEVVCAKCGKNTTVPFKPTGDRPVLCSDCFRRGGDSSSGVRPSLEPRTSSMGAQPGNSSELKQINAKLDKILKILENIEFEEVPEEGEEDEADEDQAEVGEDSEETEDLEGEEETKDGSEEVKNKSA
jgi:CxxC-x17-CxxC domain-containing protein